MGVCQSKEINQKIKTIEDSIQKMNESIKVLESRNSEDVESLEKIEKDFHEVKHLFSEATTQFKEAVQKFDVISPEKVEEEYQKAEETLEEIKDNINEEQKQLEESYAELESKLLKVPENMPICKALIDEAQKYDILSYKATAYEYAATHYATIDYNLFSEKGYKEIRQKMWIGPCKGTARFVFNIIARELAKRKIQENILNIFPDKIRYNLTKERIDIVKTVIGALIEYENRPNKKSTRKEGKKLYLLAGASFDHCEAYNYYYDMSSVELDIYNKAINEYQLIYGVI
jgi:DNA repair exonuclease SbcCD ATPase subunit